RKDIPAARVALERRRKRAAQNVNSGSSSNAKSDGDGNNNNGNPSTAASVASMSTAEDAKPRSVNRKNNSVDSSNNNRDTAPAPPVKEIMPAAASNWKGRPSSRRPSPKAAKSVEAQTERSEYIPRKGETIHRSGGGGGLTVAGQTVDGTITTAALTASTMGNDRQIEGKTPKDSSSILDASLAKSKSFGTTAEESTIGEANIETVLREDGSGFEYVQEVEVRQHRRRLQDAGPAAASLDVHERYEPISNFGYVEVTSPQPKSGHELRGDTMQSYYPQPRSPDAARQQQSGTPVSNVPRQPTDSRMTGSNSSSLRQRQQRHERQQARNISSATSTQRTTSSISTAPEEQSTASSTVVGQPLGLASLNQPSAIRTDVSQDDGNVVDTSDGSYIDDPSVPSQNGQLETVKSKARGASNVSRIPTLGSQKGRPPTSPGSRGTQNKGTQPAIEKASSLKSAPSTASFTESFDRLTVSTGGLGVMRKSRIPSPTPINPGGKRPLPQRNASSPKFNASPEKRPSPKR
ncbi:MAG: hypothetical protein SGILL_004265, partial [Bacillariaceae sp.]